MAKQVQIEATEGESVTVAIDTGNQSFEEWLTKIERMAAESRERDLAMLAKLGAQ